MSNKQVSTDKMDTRRFWVGTFLIIAGVVMLFIAMLIDPAGIIHGSILGAFGEISTLAGCLMGMDAYTSFKIKREMRNKMEE